MVFWRERSQSLRLQTSPDLLQGAYRSFLDDALSDAGTDAATARTHYKAGTRVISRSLHAYVWSVEIMRRANTLWPMGIGERVRFGEGEPPSRFAICRVRLTSASIVLT